MEWPKKKLEEWRRLRQNWPDAPWPERWDMLENFFDDPIDDLKHKLHGLRIGKWRLYLPPWLMTSKRHKRGE